jgi:hypothetical protein
LIKEQGDRFYATSNSEKASVKNIVQQIVNAEDEFNFEEIQTLFYFSMQIYFQQSSLWDGLTGGVGVLRHHIRAVAKFINSNAKHYVKA